MPQTDVELIDLNKWCEQEARRINASVPKASVEAWSAFMSYLKQVAETVAWSITEESLQSRPSGAALDFPVTTGFRVEVTLLPIYGGETVTAYREVEAGGEPQAIADIVEKLAQMTGVVATAIALNSVGNR